MWSLLLYTIVNCFCSLLANISLLFSVQLELLDKEWNLIVFQAERNLDLFEPFLAFRRALLRILGCEEHLVKHLFQSTSALRKVIVLFSAVSLFHTIFLISLWLFSWIQGLRFSLAAAALYELKELCLHRDEGTMPNTYFLSRVHTLQLSYPSVDFRKKSIFGHWTIARVVFWPSNSKAGYLWPSNYQSGQLWPSTSFKGGFFYCFKGGFAYHIFIFIIFRKNTYIRKNTFETSQGPKLSSFDSSTAKDI